MFGHKSLPSRIYSYGANAPMENLNLVSDQMFGAHRYKNAIVEMEQKRRAKVELALKRISPSLATIESKLKRVEDKIEKMYEAVKKDHVELFHKAANDPEKVSKIKELKKERKDLYSKRKELRKKLFEVAKWKKEEEKIDAWADTENKRLRSECDLYWGTYLQVEQSMGGRRSGAPPHFIRWNGDGHLAVQAQNGMSIEEAYSGKDSRIRIVEGAVEVDGTLTPKTGIKRKLGNALCYFRVGSDEKGGPIFAKIPFILHRPLPANARIKWIHFTRRRVSTKCEWRLLFVLSQDAWVKEDQASDGAIGLDFGWRLTEDGGIRVSSWVGSDGAAGELILPADWLGEMRRVERIRSVRDENFNDARKCLSTWMAERRTPEWFTEEAKDIPQWKSPARLAGLVIKWREKRIKGDDEIHFILEEWRKRDKHLYEFEANLRDQLIRRRESIYRNFAAEMRRRYKTAKFKKWDLSEIHALPEPEQNPKSPGMKEHARDAALSILTRCLKESMREVVEVSPKGTSSIHHECGSKQDLAGSEVLHTCTNCGVIYDRDENAAKNILYSGASTVLVT